MNKPLGKIPSQDDEDNPLKLEILPVHKGDKEQECRQIKENAHSPPELFPAFGERLSQEDSDGYGSANPGEQDQEAPPTDCTK